MRETPVSFAIVAPALATAGRYCQPVAMRNWPRHEPRRVQCGVDEVRPQARVAQPRLRGSGRGQVDAGRLEAVAGSRR